MGSTDNKYQFKLTASIGVKIKKKIDISYLETSLREEEIQIAEKGLTARLDLPRGL